MAERCKASVADVSCVCRSAVADEEGNEGIEIMKELFSRRYRDENGEPEVYIYNDFPEAFRNQCIHIIDSFLDCLTQNSPFSDIAEKICEEYCREKGLKYLPSNLYASKNDLSAIEKYIDESSNQDFLDFLDFIFTYYICDSSLQDKVYRFCYSYRGLIANLIDELNLRFRQHSLGYECTNGEIIPKTNAVMHQNVIKPALKLLSDERFRGAEEEYLLAFEHLKKGNNKDAILNAGKAFESVMKVICKNLGYSYSETDAAKKLVETLKANGLFPSYLDSCLNHLCSLIEEGAPVVRNKESGHGQGDEIKSTSGEYVEYVLNTVASNIVFIYKLFESRSQNDATN